MATFLEKVVNEQQSMLSPRPLASSSGCSSRKAYPRSGPAVELSNMRTRPSQGPQKNYTLSSGPDAASQRTTTSDRQHEHHASR
ncbi:hypothetical protein CGGC5_v014934 [Colletotrichum fructicola Nara gc5]|uniref:Uncharacterized protein n=1 Tax=Colletotrichum fructicola (strain Nara gc5) TaxID=1213859 RepID=A0A7J6IJU2_COLFN|nr:hypothetical protein CGGC5_v014934 [Colletotrichum fructicola Nara gc5]